MIIGIVAIAKNGAIGKGGKLPWHYSADLKFFRETTTGQAVVMGTKTWRSIGKPLPQRQNIVLSRSGRIEVPDGVMLFNDKKLAVDASKNLGVDLYVIGGAEIFKAFADEIDRWIVTVIPQTIEDADTFMSPDFLGDFDLTENRDLGDGLLVKFYDRRDKKLM